MRTLASCTATIALAAISTVVQAQEERQQIILREAPVVFLEETARQVERIRALDQAGPMLNAVIAYDDEGGGVFASVLETPLQGRSVMVKDNIEVIYWPTTAGSLALANNSTGRNAPLIDRLEAAGGRVLGKTNLSEWANFRGDNSSSGWSAIGGQTKNPHATDRSPCGSSSGSGVAVAAGFSWAAIGTETDGSITCPASVNGIVGFKPTVGMVSRTHIVPISSSQDTAGPMTQNVHDAALLLGAIAGTDADDPATALADAYVTDFTQGLAEASLYGVRIGVVANATGGNLKLERVFNQALDDLRAAGAILVEIEFEPDPQMWEDEYTVLKYEFREGIADYLASSPADLPARDLLGLIRFNQEHAEEELRWFYQEVFMASEVTTDAQAYRAARANSFRLAGPEGIDRLLAEHDVALLIAPTEGAAWPIDLVLGDHFASGIGIGSLAAIAGYPHLTVPMGDIEGLPVGLSFIAGKWQDHAVLKAGSAYERARSVSLPEPQFTPWQQSRE